MEVLKRGVGIRFKGKQRTDIEEYSISEGWVRVQAGKTVDRRGNPLTLKLTGPVEAWYEDLVTTRPSPRPTDQSENSAKALRNRRDVCLRAGAMAICRRGSARPSP